MAENIMTSVETLTSAILKNNNKTFVANQKNLGKRIFVLKTYFILLFKFAN